jgi:CDP-diacylglycerol---glycerol-3-phosphate 3-phosphatidyltransferase
VKTKFWWLPNALTIFRLVGSPFVILILAYDFQYAMIESRILALFLFLGLSATDYIDGWLARRFNACSKLGGFLDPLADKVLILPILAYYAVVLEDLFVIVAFVIIFSREVTVTLVRCVLYFKHCNVQSLQSGKLKVWAQSIAIVLFMLQMSFLGKMALSVAVVLTIFSFIELIKKRLCPLLNE